MQEKPLFYDIIDTVTRWRKSLVVVVLLTGILACVIMLLKADYYKANTIFYPASTSIQKPVFTEAERNINYYGDDHDVDRMLSIATSLDTKMEIMSEQGLLDYYNLGESEDGQDFLYKKFDKTYQVIKTEYDAIRISFQDEKPEFAAKIANYAREKIDAKTQDIIKSAQKNVLVNAKNSLKAINVQLLELTEKLKKERIKYQVYDTKSQSEAFVILESKGGNSAGLRKRIANYTEGVSHVMALEEALEQTTIQKVKTQSNVDRLASTLNSDISAIHTVQMAHPPVRKAGPKRSLYVIGAMMVMGFLAMIIIFLIENIKKV